MSLRSRLALFFGVIVAVPLLVAMFVLNALVGQEVRSRADARLEAAAGTAAVLWGERLAVAERAVALVAGRAASAREGSGLDAEVERARVESGIDFLVVTDGSGGVVASSIGSAAFEGALPTALEVSAEEGRPEILRARAALPSAPGSRVSGGWFVDASFLGELSRAAGVEAVLVGPEGALAATAGGLPTVDPARGPSDAPGGWRALEARLRGHEGAVLLLERVEGSSAAGALFWVVSLLALLFASVLGGLLASAIARPLNRLADAARAVAAGDLDTTIEVEGRGDVARLAEAFNRMTEHLRGTIRELEGSRDELRRGLDRLGNTLRSTHDLDGMLGAVLETAAATLGATSGMVLMLTPNGRALRLEVARGLEAREGGTILVGRGIAGRAGTGRPVLVPTRVESAPTPDPLEPDVETAVAVPLMRAERVMGVLALYGRDASRVFEDEDAATLSSFAGQASVAIENVLLHEEARRLSITDGLTGLWNRRYLQLVLPKETERAQRFHRPLSVLMIDLDRFKDVNDRHGHLVGDEVLVEVARVAMGSIRSHIDVVARYGGEEFVALLPETPHEGARVVAEKIRAAIAAQPVPANGDEVRVTVSIGVASFPHDGASAEGLLHSADAALYEAKEAGRDRVASAPRPGSSASAPFPGRNRL